MEKIKYSNIVNLNITLKPLTLTKLTRNKGRGNNTYTIIIINQELVQI